MAVIRGTLDGIGATAPMTVLMIASVGAAVMPGQPPRRIVSELLPGLDDSTADVLTLVSHVLHGAGAVYEGWVPLLGALPPGHRDHGGRVATMTAAHLVFGATVGRFGRR